MRVLDHHKIKPATSSLSACRHSKLLSYLLHLLSKFLNKQITLKNQYAGHPRFHSLRVIFLKQQPWHYSSSRLSFASFAVSRKNVAIEMFFLATISFVCSSAQMINWRNQSCVNLLTYLLNYWHHSHSAYMWFGKKAKEVIYGYAVACTLYWRWNYPFHKDIDHCYNATAP